MNPSIFLVGLTTLALASSSCQRSPGGGASVNNLAPPAPTSDDLAENEVIWAGLSGNPPRFIDSGDEKGLGYIEIQTKLIRKALAEAGFKIRYEYFSSARLAHEFTRKVPICFYPVEWKDPQKTFATPPDRIYSIPLDFRGEEGASIVIRKTDEARVQKYIDAKGLLNIRALLKDASLKTLLPKTEGLGPEFQGVYRSSPDGSIEITEAFKNHISTRVIRDNHQLIQMLDGNRFDYLLSAFIIEDDYKSIRGGKTPFTSIPYSIPSIQSIADPKVNLISVACSVNQTTERVMPIVNATIRALRGPEWSARQNARQAHFETRTSPHSHLNLVYRFSAEVTAGRADDWYSAQTRHFPNLKQFTVSQTPPESIPIENGEPTQSAALQNKSRASSALHKPLTWLLIAPNPNSLWLLPKADAVSLSSASQPAFRLESIWTGPVLLNDRLKAWSPRQLQQLRTKIDRPDSEGSYVELLEVALRQSKSLKSFSLVARTLLPEDLKRIQPLLKASALTELELISANAGIKEILPEVSAPLEHLNLWGSNLREVRLAPLIQRLPHLKSLNLGTTGIDPKDLEESLLSLSPETVDLRASDQVLFWTEEGAKKFGKKSFPKLEVLDLEQNALDDRHCSLFQAVPPTLKVLKLNGNQLTSHCLHPFLSKPMPRLQTLELALLRISTRPEFRFKIPPSVQHLDLSYVADDASTFTRIAFPDRLKSLTLANNPIGATLFASIAKHLDPHLDLLNLSDPKLLGAKEQSWPSSKSGESGINFTLFKDLRTAGVLSIKDFRLANVNLSGWQVRSEDLTPLTVEDLDLANTVLSNRGLNEIAASWGPSLKGINLSQNLISTSSLLSLLAKSPELASLDLSDLPDLDVPKLAPHLPAKLRALNLANTGVTDQDLRHLASKLPQTLASLNLSGSLFGTQGARILGESLKLKAPVLNTLTLNIPLSETGWRSVLPSLPSNLFALEFGPGILGAESSRAFLEALPKSLYKIRLESVKLTASHLGELTQRLPLGLGSLDFRGSTGLVGFSSQSRHSYPHASWPASLRELILYSPLGREVLDAIGLSTFPSLAHFALKDADLTGPFLARLFQPLANTSWVEVSNARIDPQMIRAINTTQPHFLCFFHSSLESGKLQDLNSWTLEKLKALSLVSKFQSSDLFRAMKKFPPNMSLINLSGARLTFADVPGLIEALPPGLHFFLAWGNEMGPEGTQLLEEHAQRVEKKTGIKLRLVY